MRLNAVTKAIRTAGRMKGGTSCNAQGIETEDRARVLRLNVYLANGHSTLAFVSFRVRGRIGLRQRLWPRCLRGPLPLQAAILVCMGPDGYLTAAAQSVLLESFAGATAAARALGDDVRATPSADQARRSPTTRPGR